MDVDDLLKGVFELCIIGSGPAGIITALEYARQNPSHRIIIVEFGQDYKNKKNTLDDSIVVKNPLNHHNPYECTNKGLGGTSTTWGGRCVMYDEVDFIDRPILNDGCTWDTGLFQELKGYLGKSAEYFECGAPEFDLHKVMNGHDKRIAELFVEGPVTDSVLERWSMPTRFGKRYGKDLIDSPHLFLLEGYEARDFSAPDGEGKISRLVVRKTGSEMIKEINAANFVLAAGAQESTRILLRNGQLFDKLSERPKALGKYYQGHLSGKIASVKFYGKPEFTDYGFQKDTEGVYLRRRFQFTKEFLVENNLLNTAIWLDNPLYHDPSHKSGAMSFMYLAMIMPFIGKKLAPPSIAHSITKGRVNKIGKHVANVIKGLPMSLLTPAAIFYRRYVLKRKLPGVFLYNPENSYALHFHAEQSPDADNRMELGEDKEELNIFYNITDQDIYSVISLHHKLDAWLRECGCGELIYWETEDNLPGLIRNNSKDGIHQTGTTRIADSAEKGVVDKNLKVWGTANLFVCSSSVFPTSGQANPTFFLGAFAVRLAEHLTNIYAKS
jgi:choline dehydrogenase-like flavoprotein